MLCSVDLKAWVDAFDDRPAYMEGCANSINTIAGEELCIEAFCHFMRSVDNAAEVLEGVVSQRGKAGKRLDAWIRITDKEDHSILYQAEVKNWSAHSLGSVWKRNVDFELHKGDRWRGHWRPDTGLLHSATQKVLTKMTYVGSPVEQRALLIFWWPVAEDDNCGEFFKVKVPTTTTSDFEELFVFSTSLYFRKLLRQGVSTIQLNLPGFHRRMSALERLIQREHG